MQIPGSQVFSVYWGDASGNIYDLNGTGTGDGGVLNTISYLRTSRHIGHDIFDGKWPWQDINLTGRVVYRRVGPLTFTIVFDWDDEYNTETCNLVLRGPAGGDTGAYFGGTFYFGGTTYFNQGFNAVNRVSNTDFSPSGKGPGFYISVSTATNVDFTIDSVDID